ncbi:hypothetical protein [Wolbachia endosymbiont of Tettigetta isshikii]
MESKLATRGFFAFFFIW